MTEINLRKCKSCGEEKQRILSGKYPNNRDKKWIDTTGKLWSGNTCSDCHCKIQAEKMKAKRSEIE